MDYQRLLELLELTEDILTLRGGPTSGNWGHSGRKGKKGGSGGGGGFKRIGVKDGKTGRKGIKRASRQTRAKDERGKKNIGGDQASKKVGLLRKENKNLSDIGLDSQSMLVSVSRSGKDRLTGKATDKELVAIDKLKKAGYATYDGETLQVTKRGKDVGGALADTREQVDRIGKFARTVGGNKRGGDDLLKISLDGYDELLKHEKHIRSLSTPLASGPGRAKSTAKDYLSDKDLKNVIKRIDVSLKEDRHISGGAKASDIIK